MTGEDGDDAQVAEAKELCDHSFDNLSGDVHGVLSVPGDHRRFVFNGVRDVVDVRPGSPWADEGRFCRIVMIGRSLDFESLQAGFTACRA